MKELLYKPGELVRVRSDLNLEDRYSMKSGEKDQYGQYPSDVATEDMCELAGQVINIEKYIDLEVGRKYYARKRYWVDEMFVGSADGVEFWSLL